MSSTRVERLKSLTKIMTQRNKVLETLEEIDEGNISPEDALEKVYDAFGQKFKVTLIQRFSKIDAEDLRDSEIAEGEELPEKYKYVSEGWFTEDGVPFLVFDYDLGEILEKNDLGLITKADFIHKL